MAGTYMHAIVPKIRSDHHCRPPHADEMLYGTTWMCDCGEVWIKSGGYGGSYFRYATIKYNFDKHTRNLRERVEYFIAALTFSSASFAGIYFINQWFTLLFVVSCVVLFYATTRLEDGFKSNKQLQEGRKEFRLDKKGRYQES